MIRKGDIVDIKYEYQNEGDHRLVWMALCDEAKGIVKITAVNSGLLIKPIYALKKKCVSKKMNARRFFVQK